MNSQTTFTSTQIAEHLYEALNGLTVGWQMANVRDDVKRAELQAPINAARESVLALLNQFDPEVRG